MGPSPRNRIGIQVDNAPELVSKKLEDMLTSWNWYRRESTNYVHENQSYVEGTIARLDSICRVTLGSAPWMPYTLWAGATVIASIIANGLPISRDGKMTPPPLAQLKDQLTVEPMSTCLEKEYEFTLLHKLGIDFH